MEGFQAFGLSHEAVVSQNDKVNITYAMKVLVVHLAEHLGRTKHVVVESHELIIGIAFHLETENAAVELPFHNRR